MMGYSQQWALSLVLILAWVASAGAAFQHPGLLHGQGDLERIRQAVQAGQEPIKSGFEQLRADSASQLDYRMRGPAREIGRNPNVRSAEFDSDAKAAYQLALMWAITGEQGYADKAKAILNGWSGSLQRVSGRDAVLMAGLGPFMMINGAEIIRHTGAGWSGQEIERFEQMLRNAIYPAVQDFAPFANGNWDGAAIQTVMAIGVFCNDRAIFERGLAYYVQGGGDGCLTHYIINEAGQCQESGRDQQHTQLGLGLLADCCEVAWQQGLDLYAQADDRLLKGFVYTARYNLGEEVPFVETVDRTGKYHHTTISTQGRGRLRPVYEMVYNHFVYRAGRASPYTRKAAEQVRPEGAGRPAADQPGFGTLSFSRSELWHPAADTPPMAPGALMGQGTPDQIALTWVASVGRRIMRSSGLMSCRGRSKPLLVLLVSPLMWTGMSKAGRCTITRLRRSTAPGGVRIPVRLECVRVCRRLGRARILAQPPSRVRPVLTVHSLRLRRPVMLLAGPATNSILSTSR